jgi:ubiquitin-conjugating enzyme (huntingtin interacting protein 2)
MSAASKRLQREFRELLTPSAAEAGFDVEWVEGNPLHWKAQFRGPPDTPHAGGPFLVDVLFGAGYPFDPPKIKFETKVWHPNVSSASGAICLDILKDAWSPAMTMQTTLLSLQALLAQPNADDPQDAEVARQYLTDPVAWRTKAAEWTRVFATPDSKEKQDLKRQALLTVCQNVQEKNQVEVDESLLRQVLHETGWNVSRAIDRLLATSC